MVSSTLVASIVLMYAVKATGTLRVSKEGEMEGLDLHEHGMVPYPEYALQGPFTVPMQMHAVTAPPHIVAQVRPESL